MTGMKDLIYIKMLMIETLHLYSYSYYYVGQQLPEFLLDL